MTVVGEFLRFGAAHGWVPAGTARLLSPPKLLRFTTPGGPLLITVRDG
ncbi:hypothetical protein [Streptomyces sp. NPDC059460]